MLKTILHKAGQILPLLFLGAALFVMHHELRLHNFRDIAAYVYDTPWHITGLAVLLTVVNYLILAGYDALALRYAGHEHIALPKVLLTSLIGYAISNNAGHAWASGGSIRYRFYTAWGVPGWDILKISLFLGVTYLVGVMTMGLGVTILLPAHIRGHLQDPEIVPLLMAICAAFLIVYWGGVIFWRKPLTIKDMEVRLPSFGAALGQTVISCVDQIVAGLILWVFLPGHVSFGFETFLVFFILAQLAGLLSQVPGGLGVFEGAFLWLLSGTIAPEEHIAVVGALAFYRVIYYFLPLAMAGAGLLAYELNVRRKELGEGGRVVARILSTIIPQIFGFLVLLTGAILLFSGVTPAIPYHMQWLRSFMPLPVIEVSHMLGSLTGLLLLFLARGIYLRLDAAWYGSLILLAVGIAVSFLKDFDWHEATALSFMMVLLLPARGYFRRKSSLLDVQLSGMWFTMIAIVLVGSTWLGFYAYRHVAYDSGLWWKFSYRDDAPRFLRTLVVLAIAITGYALARLLSVSKHRNLSLPSQSELDEAEKLVRAGDETQGYLALLGDKKIFWSETRQAFLMFNDTGKYWIVMGDPIGDAAQFESLYWRFREEADSHGAKVVVYEAGEKYLPLYLDLGLVLLKTGEEAKVKLAGYTLEGGRRETQRKTRNKYIKQGYTFSILERADVARTLPELRRISDQWLAQKNTREKRFSLGFFEENYIARTRVAVIRNPEGHIMAFANLWETDSHESFSVDLMRYDPQSPPGIMDFLFAELLLWGKQENYIWLSLGMAPLAGLERHQLAPLWHKIGTAIYDFGDEFYNFEGVRGYKDKFDPEWFPRYLAAPAGLSAPLILVQITKMVAGGWKGIFVK